MSTNKSILDIIISGNKIHGNRPEPIVSEIEIIPFNKRMNPQMAVEALLNGDCVFILDFYSTGLSILNELNYFLKTRYSNHTFDEQRDYRSVFRELSHKLLIRIYNHKLAVKKAPEIGWLKLLYPELNDFLLPFPQVQGLNSSWQWYEKGIKIPVLDFKIHPFYGTYFPTRFEHIELFDKWLSNYKGDKQSAIDIGIGSGIMSFQMLKHGFEKIYGTDINPNAIIGIHEELKNNNQSSNIALFYGDLFANCNLISELIVFNPPWIPASYDSIGIDKAIYYDADLFPRFFNEAKKQLKKDGRLAIIFSNLSQITKGEDNHPIKYELDNGGRFQKELLFQKKVNSASDKTKRNQNWRQNEIVELWILKTID